MARHLLYSNKMFIRRILLITGKCKPLAIVMLLDFYGGIEEIAQHIRLQAVFRLIPFVDFAVLH
ncbi:hypothetical protein D3C71_2155270 [compost metagenome]